MIDNNVDYKKELVTDDTYHWLGDKRISSVKYYDCPCTNV